MMELEKFRKLVGDKGKKYEDSQLREYRKQIYALAEILLDFYLLKQKRLNKTTKHFLTVHEGEL
jgi:hypothetical protein